MSLNRELPAYVNRLIAKHGTQTAVAAKIGMTLSAFSRAVNEEGTFSFENCLRLAELGGDDPSHVLRAADKYDQANLLRRLYWKTSLKNTSLSARERALIHAWRRKSLKIQDVIEVVVALMPDE